MRRRGDDFGPVVQGHPARTAGLCPVGLGLNRQHDQTAPRVRVGLVLMVLAIEDMNAPIAAEIADVNRHREALR